MVAFEQSSVTDLHAPSTATRPSTLVELADHIMNSRLS